MERFWEAHDFILKAMTTHDEAFNWEGEYFHYHPGEHLAARLAGTASAGLVDDGINDAGARAR